MICFKKVSFKNFQSYGAELQTFSLDTQNLTLITGVNGAGKSILVDVLNYVLFGKPYRKINLGDLVNRINKKGLYTELEFETNKDVWRINRGISPSVFEIYKNDVLVPVLNTKEYQSWLEINVLKFDEKIFRQIITMGSGYYLPFFKLDKAKKREIIEQFFELDILPKMKAVVKEKAKVQKEKKQEFFTVKQTAEAELSQLKQEEVRVERFNLEKAKEYDEEVLQLKKKIQYHQDDIDKNFQPEIDKKKAEIEKLQPKKLFEEKEVLEKELAKFEYLDKDKVTAQVTMKHQKEVDEINKQYSSLTAKRSELEYEIKRLENEKNAVGHMKVVTELKESLNKLDSEIAVIENKIKELKDNINFYKDNSICPECGQEIGKELAKTKLKELELREKSFLDSIVIIRSDKIKIGEQIEKEKEERIESLNAKINEFQKTLVDVGSKITALEVANRDIAAGIKKEIEDTLSADENKVDDTDKKLEKVQKELFYIDTITADLLEVEKKVLVLQAELTGWQKDLDTKKGPVQQPTDEIKKNIEMTRKKIAEVNTSMDKVSFLLNLLGHMETMLSDSGVRATVINKYLPVFNQKLKEYVNLFGLDCDIEIDSDFEAEILLKRNQKVDYDNFSGGEKQRLDLSMLFTFMSFAKMKNHIDTNLILFDEVLDSSLDEEGTDTLIDILNIFNSKGYSVFVISHRESNLNRFDDIYNVDKGGPFSKIVKVGG